MLTALGNAALGVELPDELRRCATETDDRLRLACYDTEIARLDVAPSDAAARGTASAASVPASAAAAGVATAHAKTETGAAASKPAVDAEEDFGRRGDLRKEERIESSEVSSSVVAFSRGVDRRFVVTLQNGQVWREIGPNESVRLQTGDRVRIERGSLGSFVLVAPNKRSTKVKRIK